jgi:hypothetical protein
MAEPTAPLTPPEPPEIVLYEEKVKARLAYAVIIAFVVIVALWSYKAPQLPGDTVGLVIGAFAAILGGIGQCYWQATKKS